MSQGQALELVEQLAHCFGKEGAISVIAEMRKDAGEKVAQEIKNEGGKALVIQTDVSKREEVKDMVKNVINELGKVDILVNNPTYIVISFNYFHEMDHEEWEKEIAVDWVGVLNSCHSVIPRMINQKRGRIVSITSDASKISTPNRSNQETRQLLPAFQGRLLVSWPVRD
ncbi:MAG: SDR family NAD(P)-dependent oxidoreductase [Thermodesulfobacteriota bacterium]|nr:SDR family NAD(P)-dependent oxidoreductase [Thermodesulfobacteriota bacterium]